MKNYTIWIDSDTDTNGYKNEKFQVVAFDENEQETDYSLSKACIETFDEAEVILQNIIKQNIDILFVILH